MRDDIIKLINSSELKDYFVINNYLEEIEKLLTKGIHQEDLKQSLISMTGDYSSYIDYLAEDLSEKLINIVTNY